MAFKIYDDSQNYTAQVIKLPVKETVPGLKNLVKVNVFGNDCLIGKDSDPDMLYLFFPAGAQLSHDFACLNSLYREYQLNYDHDPTKKGFFEPNRRVKAIKFQGITSTGFVIPVGSLLPVLNTDHKYLTLKAGDSFNEIDGVEICRKYFVLASSQTQGSGKGDKAAKINNKLAEVLIPNQFRFHNETSHLGNNLHQLNPNDIIVITDKWHGSSCILSKVYVAKKLTLWQKLLNKLGGQIPNRQFAYIYSSGKPKSNLPKGIEGLWKNDGPDYYTGDIWKRAMTDHKNALEDGISIYGELVGYTEGGGFIQKGYDYGCDPQGAKFDTKDNYRFVVYRITYTKPDGNVIEFSWQQIKDYCKKYNLEVVKEIYFGKLKGWLSESHPAVADEDIVNAFFNSLQLSVETIGNCVYCINNVPAEGMGIRIDGKTSYSTFKLKAKAFTKKESDDMDKGETNIEDNG